MNLSVIIPVAWRDLSRADTCLEKVLFSLRDELGRREQIIREATVEIVVDGPLFKEEELQDIKDVVQRFDMDGTDVNVHVLPSSMGAGIARNFGLAQVKPEDLVCFMDADDEMMPWSIYTRAEAWTRYLAEFPDTEPFVYTATLHQMPDPNQPGVVHRIVRDIPHPANIRVWLEKQNVLLTTSIMCRARLLQNAGGFEPNMICGEDGCLWRRVVGQNGKGSPVPVNLICQTYTIRKDSQCRMLYKANDKAFHLEPPLHGPMGQALDQVAQMRGLLFQDAKTVNDKVIALCGEPLEPILSLCTAGTGILQA